MKVKNTNPNHQVIESENAFYLISYGSTIAKKEADKVYLDAKFWDYSKTTAKNRNLFLNEDTKTTQKKIKDGIYILTNLN
jgi:hypothetical protein